MIFNLPFACHKRFVESLTDIPHLQPTLHSRYSGFLKNLENSKKPNLKYLVNLMKTDKMSITGLNIDYLLEAYEIESIQDLLNAKYDIRNKRIYPISKDEEWKPKIIEELALMKLGLLECQLDTHEIDFMLESISTA